MRYITGLCRLRGNDLDGLYDSIQGSKHSKTDLLHPSCVIFVTRVNPSYVDKTINRSPSDGPDPSMVEVHTVPTNPSQANVGKNIYLPPPPLLLRSFLMKKQMKTR
jgi:hypothetical protein